MLVRRRACRLSLETSRSNSVSCMSLGIRYTVRASSTSETPPTTKRGQSTATLLRTLATKRSTMVRPSDCRRCRLAGVNSIALMLVCASESMIKTFLPKCADSVSASASTRVDLPTPPLVFITAIALRILTAPQRADRDHPDLKATSSARQIWHTPGPCRHYVGSSGAAAAPPPGGHRLRRGPELGNGN